jgi:membrane-bound lytic murein transglycosylase D
VLGTLLPDMIQAPGGSDWDLANIDHPRVDDFVRMFTHGQRDAYATYLHRSGAYRDMISRKLEERDMPQDLIYLAMVESGFSPTAYSRAHAVGLWQFMSGTARGYGLEMNAALDERRDPEKATDAALRHLQDLHRQFGSWYLAAAAYNAGAGRVGRVMKQVTGRERGTDADFYRIRAHLPKETQDYVPLIVASARIAKDPVKYGFDEVELADPLAYDTVTVGPATELASVARAAGTTVEEIKRLNPQLKLERTRNDAESAVRIPEGSRLAFDASALRKAQPAAAAPAPARTAARSAPAPAATRTYRVRPGDNLGRIAVRHGTNVQALKRANNLRGDNIRVGTVLRIPRG